jgi:fatty acid kinase fatty acid binding subunit
VSTAVVCDTTAYLPAELVEGEGIHLVSLYVTLEGRQQRESEISDYGKWYQRLAASDEGATTSQPSVGDFVSVYEPLLAEGMDIVSVHLSAGISGTCEAATQAAARLAEEGKGGERIRVHDSRTAAGGMGLIALAAAREAAAGGDADAVEERAKRVRERMKIWFALDTLEYLRRGGRIGGASALLGSALQIKPILTFAEEVTPLERVRTRSRAFERLVSYAHEHHEGGAGTWVVQHIQEPENAERLVERGREIFGTDPDYISEVGPVLGAHAGPGMLGIGGASGL